MPFLKAVFNAKMDPGHAGNEKYDKLTEASKQGRLAPEQEQWMKQWEANKADENKTWLRAAYEKQIEQNARAKDYLKTKFNITDTSVLDYSTNRAIRKIKEINATNAERSKRQHEFDLEAAKQRGRLELEGVKQKGKGDTPEESKTKFLKTSNAWYAKLRGLNKDSLMWTPEQERDAEMYNRISGVLAEKHWKSFGGNQNTFNDTAFRIHDSVKAEVDQRVSSLSEKDVKDLAKMEITEADYRKTMEDSLIDETLALIMGAAPQKQKGAKFDKETIEGVKGIPPKPEPQIKKTKLESKDIHFEGIHFRIVNNSPKVVEQTPGGERLRSLTPEEIKIFTSSKKKKSGMPNIKLPPAPTAGELLRPKRY
jgi:hypothetical protein